MNNDEVDALLQEAAVATRGNIESVDTLVESKVGQWAAGTYRLPDGRLLTVHVDGTGTVEAAS